MQAIVTQKKSILLLQCSPEELLFHCVRLIPTTYFCLWSHEDLYIDMIASRSFAAPTRRCLQKAQSQQQWIPALTQVQRPNKLCTRQEVH